MARVAVPMPQMGESIAEGTVSVWLKKVGDQIERDEPIMEISTDKVDAEIPSPVAGVLAEITVGEGETVEVGTTVAYMETDASALDGTVESVPTPASSTPAVPATPEIADTAQSPAAPPQAEPEVAVATGAPGVEDEAERLRSRSSPLVRRIAEEHGVDLATLNGSGRLGRVTKGDILAYLEGAPGRGQLAHAGTTPGGFHEEVHHPTVAAEPGDRVVPMSRMTQLIADHMVLSRRISAHVHSYFEIDYTRIDRVRAAHRGAWEEQGVKVSYTAFIGKAVAIALREHPVINAAVSGRQVVYRAEVNLGIAVALPWGLIVPVVKRADELSLVGLARQIADLAERARAKRLSPEEVQGGTFTITNPGIYGAVIGFPIINQPQVAILGVGGIEKRAVVVPDEFGNDAVVARKRGFISLGYDHRLVNGADADQFLARVKELLETSDAIIA